MVDGLSDSYKNLKTYVSGKADDVANATKSKATDLKADILGVTGPARESMRKAIGTAENLLKSG